jgi:Mg2+ and Co2+ transporter CorA
MRISVLIIVSLAVNLMLAAVWFHQSHGAAANPDAAMAGQTPGDTGANAAARTPAENISGTANENSISTVAGKFSWQELTAQDLKEYLRKLRAANCPEPTIQDLILGEVNRRFAAKTRAYFNSPEIADQNLFWKPYQRQRDPAQARKNRERYKTYQAAQKEKTALIVELFGFDVEKQRMKEEGYDPDNNWNYATGELSFLPESKRDAVEKYLEEAQDKMQAFYAEMGGSWGPEERAKQKQLEAEKLAGLAQFLTPSEVREYELRNSQNAQQIFSDLHGVDITRAQYEALYDIHKKYGDSVYNYGDANNDEAIRKQIEQNQKDMKAEVAAALGEQKFAELDRAQDYQYQQLKSLAKRNALPADTAAKIYDFKQAAEKAAEALQSNQDLTAEARQTALAQIRAETEQSVQSALGDKLFKRYQNNGGWWINNLAPAPKK